MGKKSRITLVIGGCRSGKSAWALAEANKIPGQRRVYVATSEPKDTEMCQRVESHRAERGLAWQTIEEPVDIPEVIRASEADVLLVDCLTLWVSNQVTGGDEDDAIRGRVAQLITALAAAPCPVFLVTNEVGYGIVPDNPMARRFRDLAGFVNQQVARAADRVVLTVAGIPLSLKPAKEIS